MRRPADTQADDIVALLDLDGTVADYDAALRREMDALRAPCEPETSGRSENEPPHLRARRKLVQDRPGFWRGLKKHPVGFEVVKLLRELGFRINVLTKGPRENPGAWGEKLEWCQEHISDAEVTITLDKSLTYGRVLVDDFPPYFEPWLARRPRGLVVCVAQEWNADYAPGGPKAHPQVFRFDGTRKARASLRELLTLARDRAPGAVAPGKGPCGDPECGDGLGCICWTR